MSRTFDSLLFWIWLYIFSGKRGSDGVHFCTDILIPSAFSRIGMMRMEAKKFILYYGQPIYTYICPFSKSALPGSSRGFSSFQIGTRFPAKIKENANVRNFTS